MFTTDRQVMISTLEKLQKDTCSYQAPTCDCKFGYGTNKSPHGVGEATGCPELRVIVKVLKSMTDTQFLALCHANEMLHPNELIGKVFQAHTDDDPEDDEGGKRSHLEVRTP